MTTSLMSSQLTVLSEQLQSADSAQNCSIVDVFIIQVLSYLLKCCVLILLVCACPVYHCVICVYAIRSLDHNFPINNYLLTVLLSANKRAFH